VLCAVGTAALSAGAASAPTAEPLRRIGILMPYAEDDPEPQAMVAAFRERLQQLGWTTGREVRIDYRWTGAEAGRIRQAAKEIVALQPDVNFGRATGAIAVLHQETTTIPIVFVLVSDPVGDGFVATMARPGGNSTGFTSAEASLAGKWLELLEDTGPGFSRIPLMFNPRTAPGGGAYYLRLIEAAAAAVAVKVKVVVAGVQESAGLERIIGVFAREPGRRPGCGTGPVHHAISCGDHSGGSKIQSPCHLPVSFRGRGRWLDVLPGGRCRPSPARGRLCRSYSQRPEARRPSGAEPGKNHDPSSTPRPPRRSVSLFRRRCLPAPTR
jgi:hypothetical protein